MVVPDVLTHGLKRTLVLCEVRACALPVASDHMFESASFLSSFCTAEYREGMVK